MAFQMAGIDRRMNPSGKMFAIEVYYHSSADTRATIQAEGYFNEVLDRLLSKEFAGDNANNQSATIHVKGSDHASDIRIKRKNAAKDHADYKVAVVMEKIEYA